jgi:hypothetical protein
VNHFPLVREPTRALRYPDHEDIFHGENDSSYTHAKSSRKKMFSRKLGRILGILRIEGSSADGVMHSPPGTTQRQLFTATSTFPDHSVRRYRFEEVSLWYPREWRARVKRSPWPRQIRPMREAPGDRGYLACGVPKLVSRALTPWVQFWHPARPASRARPARKPAPARRPPSSN